MTEPQELKDEDIRTTWQRGESGSSTMLADPDTKDADGTDGDTGGDSDGTDGDTGGDADGTDSDSDSQDS